MQEALAQWWQEKYKLPSNHELFQERTVFDLLTEFYVDKFREKPIEAHRNADGEIQLTDTGDALVDRWEAQIAAGQEPDLWEAFDEESIRHLEKLRQAAELRDPYRGLSMKDTFDKVSRQAAREGLTIGKAPVFSEAEKRALAEKLLNRPTFRDPPDDE